MIDGLIRWTPGTTLDDIEEQAIRMAFEFYRNNKTLTAESLGIAIRTLDGRLEKYERADQERELRRQQERSRDTEFLARSRGLITDSVSRGGLAEPQGPSILCASSGIRVESPQTAPTERALPVQESKEVQEVLSRYGTGAVVSNSRALVAERDPQ